MKIHKKLIYLPIETKSREFDSKCLIALGCINQGNAVIIGAAGRVKLNQPGVILLKSAAGFELESILKLKQKGIKCAVIDEEGFVQTRNETQRSLRYSQATIDAVDQLFFNGCAEHELLNKLYSVQDGKGVITGNARFDFYKPSIRPYYQDYAKRLVNRHGKYILITSRFGNVTPARKVGYLDFLKNTRRIESEEQLDIFRSFFAHSKQIYYAFLEMLPRLGKEFADYTIVIRPHPSESPNGWLEVAKGLNNIKVIAEGPIGPWVLGAGAILHNGCTTGLEAFLMGRPVYSFMPFTSEEFDLKLPNSVSIECADEPSLFKKLREKLSIQSNVQLELDKSKREFAQHFLYNAGDSFAYQNISAQLNLLAEQMPEFDLSLFNEPVMTKMKNRLRKLMGIIAAYLYHFGVPLPENISSYGYSIKKNPGFSTREIRNNLRVLSGLAGYGFEDVVVEKLSEDSFLIYKQ